MVGSPQATANIATNAGVIIFFASDNRQSVPPMVNEADLNNFDNEQMLQYIQRLQATIG